MVFLSIYSSEGTVTGKKIPVWYWETSDCSAGSEVQVTSPECSFQLISRIAEGIIINPPEKKNSNLFKLNKPLKIGFI